MKVEHFPADASAEDLTQALRRDGAAVIDNLISQDLVDAVRAQMSPFIDATKLGGDNFTGASTRRTGALISRSPASRELVMHPTIVGTAKRLLHDASSIRLHLTQIIAIGPGETAQPIHRDQWAFDFFPFPNGYEVQCNTIWALSDFSEENGGTRVIPGSQLHEDKLEYRLEDTIAVEMKAGSVLLYTGAIYHGGGANRSNDTRYGLNITYARSWLRQEENQYLSVPLEVARTLPQDLLKLMGYARGAYALGYIDDVRDPIEAVLDVEGDNRLGDYDALSEKLRQQRTG